MVALIFEIVFGAFLEKYVSKNKVDTLYHHQNSGQVGVPNSEIKVILEKIVNVG